MRQVGRTLTMADAGMCRIVICDRDARWTAPVHDILHESGIRVVRTPHDAANAKCARREIWSINQRRMHLRALSRADRNRTGQRAECGGDLAGPGR